MAETPIHSLLQSLEFFKRQYAQLSDYTAQPESSHGHVTKFCLFIPGRSVVSYFYQVFLKRSHLVRPCNLWFFFLSPFSSLNFYVLVKAQATISDYDLKRRSPTRRRGEKGTGTWIPDVSASGIPVPTCLSLDFIYMKN